MVVCNTLLLNIIKTQRITVDGRLSWKNQLEILSKNFVQLYSRSEDLKSISTHDTAKIAYCIAFHNVAHYGIQFWGMSSKARGIFLLFSALKSTESCRRYFKLEVKQTTPA